MGVLGPCRMLVVILLDNADGFLPHGQFTVERWCDVKVNS